MSVYFQSIVLYGWEIGTDTYKEFDPDPEDDEWENELEREYGWRDRSEGDVAVIYDGMGGRYCYFGLVVAATNSTRNGEQDFGQQYSFTCTPDEGIEDLVQAARSLDLSFGEPAKYHVFTHAT